MARGNIEYRKTGRIARLRITASRNRLSDAAARDLIDLCTAIAWDEDIRVVLLLFPGEMVMYGDDRPGSDETVPSAVVQAVAALKVPVIAAMSGNGAGFGLELALACDMRIAEVGARFGFPGIRQGVVPAAGGTQRLPRLVGRGRAMDMILTGDMIDDDEALRGGLMNRIVPPGELIIVAEAMASGMAAKSPLALSYVKEALWNGGDMTLDQALRMELDLYLLLFSTGDRAEGITAFREKRVPEFTGE